MDTRDIRDALAQVRQIKVLANDLENRFSLTLNETPTGPAMDSREAMRVERFGEVAHRHLLVIEENGEMNLGQSLAIRREMFGDKVQSTANLFGRQGSGALFHRKTPFGKPRDDSDEIALTEEGKRIAKLWRELHGDADSRTR